jgi:hypothetical protein
LKLLNVAALRRDAVIGLRNLQTSHAAAAATVSKEGGRVMTRVEKQLVKQIETYGDLN